MKFYFVLSILSFPLAILSMDNKYSYLESSAFKIRLETAAQWLEDSAVVVEIGGGNNPIK